MIHSIVPPLLASLIFISTAGFVDDETAASVLATINLKILKTNDDTWRVQDNNGKGMGTLKVKKTDRVNWLAHQSAMEFRFEVDVSEYFEYPDSLFSDGKTQTVQRNKQLRLSIREDAPTDTLTYHVYVVEADTFVVGNSPPVMIIN